MENILKLFLILSILGASFSSFNHLQALKSIENQFSSLVLNSNKENQYEKNCLKQSSEKLIQFLIVQKNQDQEDLFSAFQLEQNLLKDFQLKNELSLQELVQFIRSNLFNQKITGNLWNKLISEIEQCQTNQIDNSFELLQNVIQQLEKNHLQEYCYGKSKGQCRKSIKEFVQKLSPQEQQNFKNTLQAEDKAFYEAAMAQGNNITKEWVFDYMDKNLVNDDLTGFAWKCVKDRLNECFEKKNIITKHLQQIHLHDLKNDQCLKSVKEKCQQTIMEKLMDMTTTQIIEFAKKMQQQSDDFKKAIKKEGKNVTMEWVQQYLDNLAKDPLTGFAWECVSETLKNCVQLKDLKNQMFFSHKKHQERGNFSEYYKCIEKYVENTCNPLIEQKVGGLSEKQKNKFYKKLLKQDSKLYKKMKKFQNKEQDIQYIESKLIKDKDTGFVWECIENGIKQCPSQENQKKQLIYQNSFSKHLKQIHLHDFDNEKCMKSIEGDCKWKIMEELMSMDEDQIREFGYKMKQQSKEFSKAVKQQGKNITIEWVYQQLDKLSQDPLTGFAWKCVFDSLKNCVQQNDLNKQYFLSNMKLQKKGNFKQGSKLQKK